MAQAANSFEWLKDKTISSYIIFAAGLLSGLLTTGFRHLFRKRNVVEVSRINQTEAISFRADVAKDIAITFQGVEVPELHHTRFSFRNRGAQTIKDITITIDVEAAKRPIGCLTMDIADPLNPERAKQTDYSAFAGDKLSHHINVTIPYLNAFTDHRDKIIIDVFCDQHLKVTGVSGAGEGWSTKFIDKYALWKEFETNITSNTSVLNVTTAMIRVLLR